MFGFVDEAGVDVEYLVPARQEGVDAACVEVAAPAFAQERDGARERPGGLVGAGGGQRVKYVGHSDDAALEGNCLASDAVGVACAIELLVVRQGDASAQSQHFG